MFARVSFVFLVSVKRHGVFTRQFHSFLLVFQSSVLTPVSSIRIHSCFIRFSFVFICVQFPYIRNFSRFTRIHSCSDLVQAQVLLTRPFSYLTGYSGFVYLVNCVCFAMSSSLHPVTNVFVYSLFHLYFACSDLSLTLLPC